MGKINKIILATLSFFPSAAFAATADVEGLIYDIINDILDPVTVLIIAIAVVILLWGVIKYIASGDSEEDRKKAKDLIIYGVIGLFVMVALWGLVNILTDTFDLDYDNIPDIPQLQRPQLK